MSVAALILCCLCTVLVSAIEGQGEERTTVDDDSHDASHALIYDAEGFLAEMDGRRHFVMIYKSRSSVVISLEVTFDQLAKKFNTVESMERIVLAKVVCNQFSELCQLLDEHDAESVLAIYEKNGTLLSVYSGKQDYESLNNFLEVILGAYQEDEDQVVPVPQPKKFLLELTGNDFYRTIASGHHFVKFYAPWCGHCQSLAPVWAELARSFEYEEWITVAKMDCTQFGTVCSDNNIRGYPTLIYFVDGRKIEEYNGARDHGSLKSYVLKNNPNYTADGNIRNREYVPMRDYVVPLTDETFLPQISEGTNFVMFYDPDCNHCKMLDPDWRSLALIFLNDGISFAKLDCTQYADICTEQSVYSLPTLVFFKDGRRLEKYDGILNHRSIKEFVISMMNMSAEDGLLPDDVSFVVELNQANFLQHIENGYCLVNFFKPWCDFCKNLAPTWEDLARKLSNDREITIAKVDCSVSDLMCEQHGIKGYPTIMMFHQGKQRDFYTGSHDLESLFNYVFGYLHHGEL